MNRSGFVMQKRIKVSETYEEPVTIEVSDSTGTYRVAWHRTDGPHEEFEVSPSENETVDEAIARDLKARLGP